MIEYILQTIGLCGWLIVIRFAVAKYRYIGRLEALAVIIVALFAFMGMLADLVEFGRSSQWIWYPTNYIAIWSYWKMIDLIEKMKDDSDSSRS